MLGLVTLLVAGSIGYVVGRKNALAAQVVPQAPVVAPLPVASNTSQALGILLAKTPDEIAQTDILPSSHRMAPQTSVGSIESKI